MAGLDQSPTIYDVAERAGVSANTVSRALNGKNGVSRGTRARIVALAKEMNYQPHIGARSLRVKRKGCVGLTIPAPVDTVPVSRDFFIYLCAELNRIFGSRGERICLDLNPFIESGSADYGRSIWQKLFSACILAGPLATNDITIHRIHSSGVPYVALGRLDSLPECSCATVDYDRGAYECVRYLTNRGHRRIGMLKALSDYQPGVERHRGYLRALEMEGIEPDERLIQPVCFVMRNVANATYRLLNDKSVTAMVDASGIEDGAAIREGARRAGRIPGKDFDIVCWTYSMDVPVMEEACAHLWLPVRESASEGIELLSEWFWEKREGPVRVVYDPTIVRTDLLVARSREQQPVTNRLFYASL